MNFKNLLVSLILISIILYILFSTKFINNKSLCNYKHLSQNNILNIEIPGFYKIFNPSICKYKDGYILCARYSNKIIKNLFMYFYSNVDYRSKICFIILNNHFKIIQTIFPNMESKFLEDPRITHFNNLFFVSITEFINKKNIYPSIYIFDENLCFLKKLDYKWENYYNINNSIKPSSFIQKNWCPFQYNQKLFIHTDSFPIWNVFQLELLNDDIVMKNKIINFDTTNLFKDLHQKIIRCSTSWVDFTNGTFLCGLHTKEFKIKQFLPTIRSIFVEIDKLSFKPIRKTKVICFDFKNDSRIQFLSGMESDEYYIYITFGIGDYKSQIKKISKNYINSLLY